jgi:hypothetical protein
MTMALQSGNAIQSKFFSFYVLFPLGFFPSSFCLH